MDKCKNCTYICFWISCLVISINILSCISFANLASAIDLKIEEFYDHSVYYIWLKTTSVLFNKLSIAEHGCFNSMTPCTYFIQNK